MPWSIDSGKAYPTKRMEKRFFYIFLQKLGGESGL